MSVGLGKFLMDSNILSDGMRLVGKTLNPAKSIVSWQNWNCDGFMTMLFLPQMSRYSATFMKCLAVSTTWVHMAEISETKLGV